MKSNILSVVTLGIVGCCLISCKQNKAETARHYIETKYFDQSTKPGDDFYQYVNGSWMKTAKIPGDQTYIGSFYDVIDSTKIRVKSILEDAAKNESKVGSIQQKVGDFYASGMDSVTINKRGFDPVKPLLGKIDAIKSVPEFMKLVAEEEKNGTESLISFMVYADQKNSTMNIAWLTQKGLGLPDRDYYFKNDKETKAIQDAYKKYLTTLFKLTGSDNATAIKNTETVYNIEKDLASSHKTNVQLRDVAANYHKMELSKIEKDQPNLGWNQFFTTLGAKAESLDMEQPAYYDKLNSMLKTVPLSDWKLYLKVHSLTSYANLLSSDFEKASFDYKKSLTGQKKQKPRWELLGMETDKELGDALGQLYAEKYFPPEAKKRMDELITNLTKAFANRIQNLDWMSAATKKTAEEKLNAIGRKIGYPDKWRDYSKVTIDKTKYFENSIACNRNNFEFQLSQLGKPVDKTLWITTPATVNAFYNPYLNDINFPAAILQYPMFDKDADDAINYGGIGMVIGHELTHGFDDQGSQYDKIGNMKDWWLKEDKTKFNEKVKQIQKLYSGFTVLNNLHVNGELTTGENIADFGGIAIAYDAFKMTKQGKGNTKIDGFTPDQRFFLALGNAWRTKMTDEMSRQLINIDTHSPDNWRVLGPLMNFEPFYKAFNLKPGNKMYREPKDRIKIW
jgi:putative endopeptidase